jgi:iron complex transport system substrate-binding protein
MTEVRAHRTCGESPLTPAERNAAASVLPGGGPVRADHLSVRSFAAKASALLCLFLLLAPLVATAGTMRTVTDPAGRTVQVPVHPERVVALAPNLTEIAYAVGAGDQLVGRTRYADYPPEAEGLEIVGTYVNLNTERIALMRPDLCLAVRDGTPLHALRDLERLGIPVFAVTTDTLDEIMTAVLALGDVLDHAPEAEAIVDEMRRDLDGISRLTAAAASTPRVFYQISARPIISCGRGTHVDELIRLAGGVNLAAGTGGYPRFGEEQVLALNPDVVILSSMDRNGQIHEARRFWEQWPQIRAVAGDRVVQLDSDLLDRPTPRMVKGLKQLVQALHPELADREGQP